MDSRIPVRGVALTHEVRSSGETVLFDETGDQLIVLNDIGAAIWLLIDSERPVETIVEVVVDTLKAPAELVADDIGVFLKELEGKGLITWR
ncbi:MAG: PqqD family protein [Gammaproteobacteria bacterium]|jgi:hypothetical protein|nr:PqqD family protein [Gammaproteobacteria bacterium]MBT4493577.1 PqqD family protein [Gammaproteobacteria bacterium]MBT7372312.1 PqqD family protein [Gammaproteobacteria bacterium]